MVGVVGFEPTQPEGNRFTVCCDSPTSPYSYMAPRAGLEPATSKLTVLHSTIELPRNLLLH